MKQNHTLPIQDRQVCGPSTQVLIGSGSFLLVVLSHRVGSRMFKYTYIIGGHVLGHHYNGLTPCISSFLAQYTTMYNDRQTTWQRMKLISQSAYVAYKMGEAQHCFHRRNLHVIPPLTNPADRAVKWIPLCPNSHLSRSVNLQQGWTNPICHAAMVIRKKAFYWVEHPAKPNNLVGWVTGFPVGNWHLVSSLLSVLWLCDCIWDIVAGCFPDK